MQPAADPDRSSSSTSRRRAPPRQPGSGPGTGARRPPSRQPALTEREQQILAFEASGGSTPAPRSRPSGTPSALSSTRYYQLLNGLLDNPAALEHDPVLIGRLRRLRSTRARTRRR